MGGCYWGWMAVKEREERHVARAERRGRYAWGERDWKLWRPGTSTRCSHETRFARGDGGEDACVQVGGTCLSRNRNRLPARASGQDTSYRRTSNAVSSPTLVPYCWHPSHSKAVSKNRLLIPNRCLRVRRRNDRRVQHDFCRPLQPRIADRLRYPYHGAKEPAHAVVQLCGWERYVERGV